MNKERKYIKVRIIRTDLGDLINIIDQSHITNSFGKDCNSFSDSKSFILKSVSYPDIYLEGAGIYVRGNNYHKNNKIVFIENDYELTDNFINAVEEYNNTFSQGENTKEYIRIFNFKNRIGNLNGK